jgi:hypothetical protein
MNLRVGARAGKERLKPLLRRATGGRYLRVLVEDRRADGE